MLKRFRSFAFVAWLLEPPPGVTGDADRLGARLLGVLMLVHVALAAVVIVAVNLVWWHLTGRSIWGDKDAWVMLGVLVVIVAAFVALRAGHYRAGALIYVASTLALPLVAPFVPDPNAEIGLIATAIIPVLLAAIVLSYRWVFGVLGIAVLGAAAQLLLSDMPATKKGTGFALVIVVAVAGGLILVFRHHLGTLERRRLEQIRQGEKSYRHLFETVLDGIMVADSGGRLIDVNDATCRQLGYPRDELIGRRVDEISGRSSPQVAAAMRSVREGGHALYQTLHRRKDGGTIPVELSLTGVEFEGGRAFLGVARDLTERVRVEEEKRALEAQLQQAVKMEAVGQLAGGVAHDFNNLLTAILGNAEMALQGLPNQSPLAGPLQQIVKAGDSAASLTRQLLAFSRKQIISSQPTDLNDLIAQMHKMLTRLIGEDITLKALPGEGLGTVSVDRGLIEQVIVNLAVNARDAMPDGGILVLQTANVTVEADYKARYPELEVGDYVSFAVTDTGTGMAPEVQARLFEPFFTTKPKGRGTGLGLATTYGAVKQSGGHIQVHSEKGHGTTFRVFLPRIPDVDGASAADPPAPVPRGHETILLVEDDDEIRSLASRVLEELGYTVLTAAGAADALTLAGPFHEPIDLLLTDVVMPGLNGRQLAERLVQIHPETTVLYTSGYTDDVVLQRGVRHDTVAFLSKPFTPQALGSKVRSVLDRPKA